MNTAVRAIDSDKLDGIADDRYLTFVSDILCNSAFLRLNDIRHHDSTIFSHVLRVSLLSYRVCGFLGWNAREAARGGLLHDFFLYDWHDKYDPDKPAGLHGFAHPAVAVANAKRHFEITPREENIIVRHMWPLTPVPPRYREAWVVMIADKIVASREFLNKYRLAIYSAFFARRAPAG